MRRILLFAFGLFISGFAFSQTDTTTARPNLVTKTFPRTSDHFVVQLGYTGWANKPDSINTKGLSRTVNVYFMFDFPFKTNPRFSAAIGAGVASDNIYFDKTYVGIKDATSTLRFQNLSDTNHFKKYKLATTYLEAPVELRFSSKPDDNKRSVKAAVGLKIGTLLSAMVKGKNFEDKAGNTLISYTQKEKSKQFFNQNRLSASARVGFGHFSLFGTYAITPLLKEGAGPVIRPYTVGLMISGL